MFKKNPKQQQQKTPHSQFSRGSHTSLWPPRLLTHLFWASLELNPFPAVFTENNHARGVRKEGPKRVTILSRVHPETGRAARLRLVSDWE